MKNTSDKTSNNHITPAENVSIEPHLSSQNEVAQMAERHQKLFTDFNTLQIKSDVRYDDGTLDQTITADIKIEKGKQILISARVLFFTAKVYLTPERASFYETFNKTYYEGDFEFISHFLGTDVTYENVENLLLGKAFYDLDTNAYQVLNSHELELKLNSFLLRLVFGTQYQIASTEISQKNDTDKFLVSYPSYQSSENTYLPKSIHIQVMQKKDITIDLDYKKIYLNPTLDFRYKVPEGYKSIKK